MQAIEITTRDGRPLRIREARGSDAGEVLAYVNRICGETDLLSFGPGEFELTRRRSGQHTEDPG